MWSVRTHPPRSKPKLQKAKLVQPYRSSCLSPFSNRTHLLGRLAQAASEALQDASWPPATEFLLQLIWNFSPQETTQNVFVQLRSWLNHLARLKSCTSFDLSWLIELLSGFALVAAALRAPLTHRDQLVPQRAAEHQAASAASGVFPQLTPVRAAQRSDRAHQCTQEPVPSSPLLNCFWNCNEIRSVLCYSVFTLDSPIHSQTSAPGQLPALFMAHTTSPATVNIRGLKHTQSRATQVQPWLPFQSVINPFPTAWANQRQGVLQRKWSRNKGQITTSR